MVLRQCPVLAAHVTVPRSSASLSGQVERQAIDEAASEFASCPPAQAVADQPIKHLHRDLVRNFGVTVTSEAPVSIFVSRVPDALRGHTPDQLHALLLDRDPGAIPVFVKRYDALKQYIRLIAFDVVTDERKMPHIVAAATGREDWGKLLIQEEVRAPAAHMANACGRA
jgi:hypothetical protein